MLFWSGSGPLKERNACFLGRIDTRNTEGRLSWWLSREHILMFKAKKLSQDTLASITVTGRLSVVRHTCCYCHCNTWTAPLCVLFVAGGQLIIDHCSGGSSYHGYSPQLITRPPPGHQGSYSPFPGPAQLIYWPPGCGYPSPPISPNTYYMTGGPPSSCLLSPTSSAFSSGVTSPVPEQVSPTPPHNQAQVRRFHWNKKYFKIFLVKKYLSKLLQKYFSCADVKIFELLRSKKNFELKNIWVF